MITRTLGLALIAAYVVLYHYDHSLSFVPGLFMLFVIGQGLAQAIFPRIRRLNDPPLLREVVYLASGFMGSIFLTTVLALFHIASVDVLMWIFVGAATVAWLTVRPDEKFPLSLNKESGLLALVLLSGVVLMAYIRSAYGWPVVPGMDPYHYMAIAHGYLQDPVPSFLFLNHHLSEPVSYYVYLYQFSQLFHVPVLAFFYYGPFLTLPLFGVQIYLLGRFLFKKSELAFIGVLLLFTIVGSTHFYGAHDIYTTSVTQLIFLSFWLYGLMAPRAQTQGRRFWVTMAVLMGFLAIIYPFSLVVNVPLLTLLLRDRKSFKWLYAGTVLLFVGALFYQGREVWPIWSLDYVWEQWKGFKSLLLLSYASIHYILFGLGLFLLLFKSIRKRIHPLAWPLWGYSFILFLLFLSHYSHIASRLEWYFRPHLVLVGVVPFLLLSEFKLKKKFGHVLLGAVVSGLLFFFIAYQAFLGFVNPDDNDYILGPTLSYRLGQLYYGGAISEEELIFFQWLAENTDETDYLITDPYMGDLIRGSAYRMASSALILPGGQSPNISGEHFIDLKRLNFSYLSELHREISEERDVNLLALGAEMRAELSDHGYTVENVLILGSPRTAYWYFRNEQMITNGTYTQETIPLKFYAIWPFTFADIGRHLFEPSPTWDPIYASPNVFLFRTPIDNPI